MTTRKGVPSDGKGFIAIKDFKWKDWEFRKADKVPGGIARMNPDSTERVKPQ